MSCYRRKVPPLRLSGLFALALALSIICGSYLPSYSQPSNTKPRDALVEEIREDIMRRLEIDGEPLSHEEIEKLYLEEAEAAGLSYRELIKLYEQEFAEQKAAKKPGPWEKFKPSIGWVAAGLLFVLLVFRDVLKDWLKGFLQKAGAFIYTSFAGTPLFREVALRKYRTSLVQNYEQLPMPFIKNRDPLRMDEVYVPLKVADVRDEETRFEQQDTVAKHTQIDAYQAIADYRRLMVIGEPGSGKSVLLKYLAWAYGLGKLEMLSDRPVVVLLELYRLSDSSLDEAKLIQALVAAFDRNQFPKAQQFVRHGLQNGIFLLLLDGLDEVNSEVRSHVVGVIRDLLKKYSKCRVIVTCRTAVYEDEFSDIVERKLEVVEFTDQQMRQFLKAWKLEMQRARKSINQMMAALRERPLILKLARNPLLLTLIAYLYTEPAFVLPRSRAEFYEKSTDILLDQREYKGDDEYQHNRYEADEKRRVLQHLALYTQDHSKDLKDRRSLKRDVVREQVREVLPSLDISPDKAREILDEIIERSGLFMRIDGGERCIFPHLTIQEYFAAAALKDREEELVSRFEADPTAWREVVKLWCSLANESTSLIRAVYKQDAISGLECLAEARQVDQALANQIIEQFKPRLNQPQTDDTLARAFGAVAANDRTRGKAVFEFLEATIFDVRSLDVKRKNAADALSRTNLPKAAAALIKWYGDSQSIVRMGDLAVPGLAELASQGNIQALDDLHAIGTPDAATAFVPLLWHGQIAVSGRTAWYLGNLLLLPGIEETLRNYELTSQQKQSETLDWIWQPFKESADSALPIIAGRTAYELQQDLWAVIPNIRPVLDPRLVVPLCAIHIKPNRLTYTFPAAIETLLEQPGETPELALKFKMAVSDLLGEQPATDRQWQLLLSGLSPRLELDLLHRMISQQPPNRNHWRNLFQIVDYELRTGWHYRGVLLISALLSAITLVQLAAMAFAEPENPVAVGSFSLGSTILLAACLAMWHGIEQSLEPNLFWELGPLGLVTFSSQLLQLLRRRLVWPGIEALYEGITAFAFAGAGVAFAGAGVAFAFAFAGAGASAIVAGAGAFAGAVAGAGAGYALGVWHQLKPTPERRWLRFLAIFAFPWFCWFPITISVSTHALYHLLTRVSPFNFLIWQQTVFIALIITGLCAVLWWRGQWLDARASNPFQGGALGRALGAKRQGPITSEAPGP